MGGRRGDISSKSMGEAKVLWASTPRAASWQHISRIRIRIKIRIRDKTGKTWYSGDASSGERARAMVRQAHGSVCDRDSAEAGQTSIKIRVSQ